MGQYSYLPTGEVEFNGIIYPGISARATQINFNFKRWVLHWKNRINEIKNLKLSYGQIANIHEDFVHDTLTYAGTKQMVDKYQEHAELANRLKIAFCQAYSNYRDSRSGIFAFFIGLFANKLLNKLNFPRSKM